MKFDRLETSSKRVRLSGNLQPRGVQTGMSSVTMLFFGLPFIGVGIWALLAGLRLISIDESNLHAPHWVLAVCGAVFALAGLFVWSMSWRQLKANRRRQDLERRDPALADYPWDEHGFTPPRWSRALNGIGGLLFFALFLSMFNWWAFGAKGPWMVKIIVGIFDLIWLFLVWQVGLLVGRTIKFGPTRIEFVRFPFRPGEALTLHWVVPRGITRVAKGAMTLRCVEEWHEVSGSGKNRSRRLVQEAIWSATGHLDQPQDLRAEMPEELRFDIPADVPGTLLNVRDTKPIFWELVMDLDLAGLDFKESFMIPVYHAG